MQLRTLVPEPLHELSRATYSRVSQATRSLRALPDFIVIGGQRCGTTSLFKNIAEHPQVLRPGIEKGVDYYSLYPQRGIDWYRGNFPIRALARLRTARHGEPQVFEACTYYMFHPFAIERIARDLPDVKLVAMLRDPVERAFSAYKHEFARGFETEPDFVRALDLEDSRLAGEVERMAADPTYESHAHRHHAYRARGQYAEQLERVFAHFPREQVFVCDSESYFAQPAEQYRELTRFLGLEDYLPARFDQFNARPSKPMPEEARARLVEYYAPHDRALTELLGRQPGWISV
ncbi:hypothetical protein GCM10023258_11670 [Terrabacter aeriphilus]|uniref:Sulfotransferase domain-containing protein n=1 Tax=Terrabacter aeriphilus TaxID=515662 RepID=A0ABP9J685_9MICO